MTPIDQRNLESLKVSKRAKSSTSGATVDAGAITVQSKGGRIHATSAPAITPREPLPAPVPRQRPHRKRRGGRRREDERLARTQSQQITIELV